MIELKQHVYMDNGTEYDIVHIYAESGYFVEKSKKKADRSSVGWHIQLGTNDSAENYVEVPDENDLHLVPETLTPLYVHVVTQEEVEAEVKARELEFPEG